MGSVNICFSRSAYASSLERPIGEHAVVHSEVEVPEKDKRYIKRLFTTDICYGNGNPRSESVMLQTGTTNRDAVTYKKL